MVQSATASRIEARLDCNNTHVVGTHIKHLEASVEFAPFTGGTALRHCRRCEHDLAVDGSEPHNDVKSVSA